MCQSAEPCANHKDQDVESQVEITSDEVQPEWRCTNKDICYGVIWYLFLQVLVGCWYILFMWILTQISDYVHGTQG